MKKINQWLSLAILLFAGNAFAATHTIQVGVSNNNTFTPNSITTVVVGDIIQWVWVSGSHTTFSVNIPAGATSWNNSINSGATTFNYTVTQPGTYSYQCSPHGPSMSGSFTVTGTTPVLDKTSQVYSSFEISPNPTADLLTFKFNADQSFKANLLVFDGN